MPRRWIAGLLGPTAVLVGAIALFDFDLLKERLLFLSADGVVEAHTFLQLRLVLLAIGTIGLGLFWYDRLLDQLAAFMLWLEQLPRPVFLVGMLVAALLLRVAVLVFVGVTLKSDSFAYNELAIDWARTGAYVEAGKPTGYWPPGAPFLFSRIYLLFGELPIIAAAVHVLLNLLTCVVTWRLIRRLHSERTARLAAVIMALLPSQVFFVTLLVSEHLFTLLLLVSLWLMIEGERGPGVRLWPYLFGGLTLGAAVLTRSVVYALPVILIAYWLIRHEPFKWILARTLVLGAGCALVVLPWIIRNYHQVGAATVSTTGGVNFYIGNNPQSGMGWINIDTVLFVLHDPALEAHNDSLGYALGRQYIIDQPLAFLKRSILKTGYLYSSDVDAIIYQLMDSARAVRFDWYVLFGWIMQTAFFALLLLCIAGLVVYLTRRREPQLGGFLLLLLVLLYWTAIHAVFFGAGRFHYPVVPILAAFAALYLNSRADRLRSQRAGFAA